METILVYLVSTVKQNNRRTFRGERGGAALPFSTTHQTALGNKAPNLDYLSCCSPIGPTSSTVYVPAKGFKITKGSPRYYSTSSDGGGHNKARLLRGMWFAAVRRRQPRRARDQRIKFGRLELVSSANGDIHFGCAAVDQKNPKLLNFERYPPQQ